MSARPAGSPVSAAAQRAELQRAFELHRRGFRREAIDGYRAILSVDPQQADARRLLAAALLDLGEPEHALSQIERALEQRSDAAELWALRGVAYGFLARFDLALESYEHAVRLQPDRSSPRFNRGLLYLLTGDWARGWQGWEERLAALGMAPMLAPGAPLWDGRAELTGRKLLLIAEQGLGDAIQFARYVPLLAERGARVWLTVPPPLRRLFASLPGVARVVQDGETVSGFDLQCLLLSLPALLGTTLQSVPAQIPYLAAEPARSAAWQERLGPRTRPRIGVACSGSARHGNDRNRSLALEKLACLAEVDAEFHLVQDELRAADEPWLQRLGWIDHRAQLSDMAETAALVQCLDAVVSVDTSVAHLAGALGRSLYVLLPAVPDWRWLLERADSPWYPSARLIRQRRVGDWEPAIAELSGLLRERTRTEVRGDGRP